MKILPLLVVFLAFLNLQIVFSITNDGFKYSRASFNDNNGNYRNSLYNLLGDLTSLTTNNGLYNYSTTTTKTRNQLHGLYLCHGDIDPQACRSCLNAAKKHILENYSCATKALVWYNHCMIRYSNESFFGKWEENPWTASWDGNKIKGSQFEFMTILRSTMKGLAIQASNGHNANKFASKTVKFSRFGSLNVMVQCTPDLAASDCYRCLKHANHQFLRMHGSTKGEALHSSCMAKYTTTTVSNNKMKSLPLRPPTHVNSTLISLKDLGAHNLDDADKSE